MLGRRGSRSRVRRSSTTSYSPLFRVTEAVFATGSYVCRTHVESLQLGLIWVAVAACPHFTRYEYPYFAPTLKRVYDGSSVRVLHSSKGVGALEGAGVAQKVRQQVWFGIEEQKRFVGGYRQ